MTLSTVHKGLRHLAGRLDRASKSRVRDDRLSQAGLLNAHKIHTFTTYEELWTLMQLAIQVPANGRILEIGCYLGASTCYLAAGAADRNITLYCVDTWNNETMPGGERDTFEEFKSNVRSVMSKIRPIRKESNRLVSSDLQTPIDLAFLDGNHDYEAVRADFDIVAPWMAPAGIIAMHDTRSFPGVARTLGEVLIASQWRLIGHVENLSWLQRLPESHTQPA